ncbi:MAG: prephenate dehydrogenase/arogenate dehydrogenase family protein [Halieaceae bacterium]|nr:prephenate dehydrogenase/arogenate dehydrogenase family protein [Halieaceae bacterium]
MNVGFLGLGLIGASLACALRDRPEINKLIGYGHRPSTVDAALSLGIIDQAVEQPEYLLDCCDLVVIATPTLLAQQQMVQLVGIAETMESPPILTDVASVKGNLWRAVESMGLPSWPQYVVLGHPIAGSERSGVHAAKADLFVDHRVILTPHEGSSATAVQSVAKLWQWAGAEVISMPVELHDKVLAATSHLPHMLAYSLVDTLAQSDLSVDIFRYAAGGFRDFTRIASSDPVMWRDIALANKDELLRAIDSFSNGLSDLRAAIASSDGERMMTIFKRAKNSRDTFLVKQNAKKD